MTDKEALKLALEALEYWDVHGKLHQPTEEAITAIKEALAQRIEQEPVACVGPWHDARLTLIPRYSHQTFEREQPLYATPPQRKWVGLTDEEMEATFIECGGKWNGDFWKIEDADFHPFLRTIEAKLKEKNNA